MLFSEYCYKWLSIKQSKLSPLTFDNYKATVERHIIPFFNNLNIEDVTALDVQDFVSMLSSSYSPATVQRKYAVLRSLLKKAAAFRLCSDVCSQGIELAKPTRPQIEFYNAEELDVLISAFDNLPLKWKALFVLALETGARRGELLALRWDRIDFASRKIYILESVYKKKGGVGVKVPKNKKGRSCYISNYCVQLLKEYRVFSVSGEDSVIFSLHPDTVSHFFSSFCKKTGLHGHLHCLRHTCATSMLRSGTDLKIVADRLGHASITTTALYLHGDDYEDFKATDRLEQYFYNSSKFEYSQKEIERSVLRSDFFKGQNKKWTCGNRSIF